MIWSDWNKADKTLLLALVLFFFMLCLHLQYPQSIVVDGLLFCTEAALVGGIADWFAVTALFRKPLGFPYHTAILPNRRQAFIDASVTMVQKEFFSRRKIFGRLEQVRLMPLLLGWLSQPETEAKLTGQLVGYGRSFLAQQDPAQQSAALAGKIRSVLLRVEPEQLVRLAGGWLRQSGRDQEILQRLAVGLQGMVETPAARQSIQQTLEAYAQAQTKSPLEAFLASFAQAVDLVNYEEAATLIQRQLLRMLQELGQRDSALQQELLGLIYEQAALLETDPAVQQLLRELRDSLMKELPLEQALDRMFTQLKDQLLTTADGRAETADRPLQELQSGLEQIVRREYQRTLQLLAEDEELQTSIGAFLYDVIARSALHAQTLVGVIVTKVLSRLTDEQLNHLVYDKVEPDFLWIRMNGSIVGSGIGLVLFLLLQLTNR